MAWYSGTYICGHEGRVDIVGPGRDRQWKIDRAFNGVCPECHARNLAAENERAMQKAEKLGFLELEGTEKQVKWANSIRMEFYRNFSKEIKSLCPGKGMDYINSIMEYVLTNCLKASWWIEYKGYYSMIYDMAREEIKEREEKAVEEVIKRDLILESAVRPENSITDQIVEIKVTDEKIQVVFEKNNVLIDVVKKLGYSWKGVWEKEISEKTGPAKERAAELGNELLNAGFPVSILDKGIREDAVKGKFEPECKRWILKKKDADILRIWWRGRDEELYSRARKIKGSKYNGGCVEVPIKYYNEIMDFVELNDFKISEEALKLIWSYKTQYENIKEVLPEEIIEEEKPDKLQKILESSREVLPDLRDEE